MVPLAKRYKIVFDVKGCIFAKSCAAANPKYWNLDNKIEKAVLVGSTQNKKTGNFELIIDEEDLERNMKAARVCPASVIHIFDLESGKQLI